MRVLPLSLALLTALATTAAAKPARPVTGAILPRTPPPLEIVRGADPAAGHVAGRADAIVTCAHRSRPTFLRLRASLRWDARGRVVRASVSGGSAATNRCASRALAGTIAAPGRGAASVTFVVRKPDVAIAPKPAKSSLQSCKVDGDCTLHFQTIACVPGDPVAVHHAADRDAVQAAFPVRHVPCGMGGPQYEQLRMSNENRYAATCAQARCTVHDAGPQPTMFGP